jgi:hypothetical protein
MSEIEKRKSELLEAALRFLGKVGRSHHADALGYTVFYDDADCDGLCLADDIQAVLNQERSK